MIDAFVGTVFRRRGGDSLGVGHGFNSVTIVTKFSGGFSSYFHVFSTTIGPRSGFNRGPRFPSIVVKSGRSDSAAKNRAITARLDRDPGVLPSFVCAVR